MTAAIKTPAELAAAIPDAQKSNYLDLFALSEFLTKSVIPSEYRAGAALADAIVPTATGLALLERVREEIADVPLADQMVALLALFGASDLLIDLDRTDAAEVRRTLSDDIASSRLLLAWAHGRTLYDKYFEQGLGELPDLDYEQTLDLLTGTPQGTSQIGHLIAGPLGITESAQLRSFPPLRRVRLWHCSEIGCEVGHSCELGTGVGPAVAFHQALAFDLAERRVTWAPWQSVFDEICAFDFYDDLNAADLPFLIANAMSVPEQAALLEGLGSAVDNPRAASSPELLQRILAFQDTAIASSMDRLVLSGSIRIPDTELRRSTHYGSPNAGILSTEAQLSKLGLRFVPVRIPIGVPRLRALIKWVFRGPDEEQALTWQLRCIDGPDVASRLDNYVQSAEPREVVRDVVLSRRESLERAVEFLRFGDFEFEMTAQGEELLVDRLLWKIGFDARVYPKYMNRLQERIAILESAVSGTGDEDALRSAATNVFVSLEELLDESLAFSTWALWEDHAQRTNFEYSPRAARQFAAQFLNSKNALRNHNGQPVRFSADGRNTLWPLIEGFAALATLNESLTDGEIHYRRPQASLPLYVGKSHTAYFPWRHSAAYFDLCASEVLAFNAHLRWITARLNEARIGDIRNRSDHERRDFPAPDELGRAATAIGEVALRMEEVGSVPLVRYRGPYAADRYDRARSGMVDYAGRTLEVTREALLMFGPWPHLSQPVVVAPGLHVNGTRQQLRFAYREHSDFTEMWANYPKRRLRSEGDPASHPSFDPEMLEA